jgi:RNA polymerase sigma factor (sigma-70 family)
LVRRYTNLVYSVARRRLGNVSLAQEITQLVFIRLAKTVPKLRGDNELAAWLHRTTVHVSIDLWRSESRRRARESNAAVMHAEPDEALAWNDMALVLDESVNELNDPDRQAILLRFFNQKTMRELGTALGISEDAAKMRVNRALGRLRDKLGARGVASASAIALGTALSQHAVEAAPAQLVATLAASNFAAAAGGGTGIAVVDFLPQVFNLKFVVGTVAVLSVGTAALLWLHTQRSPTAGDSAESMAAEIAPQENAAMLAPANQGAEDLVEAEHQPDPLELLLAVAQARQQITSGSVELQSTSEFFPSVGAQRTDQRTFSVLFAGEKFRFEQTGVEFRHTTSGEDESAEANELRAQAETMDQETAVQEGLIEPFEARYVSAWDGLALMQYSESDGEPGDTTIDEPGRSATSAFNPRCLGLGIHLFAKATVEDYLGYLEAKSITLVGQEHLKGVPVWHVQVRTRKDATLDFWIDATRPVRVLKHAIGSDVALSKYDDSRPEDPIPSEVRVLGHRDGRPSWDHRFVQTKAQFNLPVDPASFTLAGLGMPVGTPVVDVRIHRSLGYWTGTGLSEFPQKKTGKEPERPPDMAEMMKLLENDPASSEALYAAAWILINTPDGAEVEKAADVIRQHHLDRPDLDFLCQELERVRHRSARGLLEAILQHNPSREVQADACLALATMRKDEAKYGAKKEAAAEAEQLFERLTADFGDIKRSGHALDRLAQPELYELRHLTIGRPAPEIVGVDLDGRKMRLSAYRGKVVVLTFWSAYQSDGGRPEMNTIRKLLEDFPAVAALGVYCGEDLELAREIEQTARLALIPGRPVRADRHRLEQSGLALGLDTRFPWHHSSPRRL